MVQCHNRTNNDQICSSWRMKTRLENAQQPQFNFLKLYNNFNYLWSPAAAAPTTKHKSPDVCLCVFMHFYYLFISSHSGCSFCWFGCFDFRTFRWWQHFSLQNSRTLLHYAFSLALESFKHTRPLAVFLCALMSIRSFCGCCRSQCERKRRTEKEWEKHNSQCNSTYLLLLFLKHFYCFSACERAIASAEWMK